MLMIAFFVFVFRQTLPVIPAIMDIEVNILLISTFPNIVAEWETAP